jgi:hypothetical protein
MIFRDFVYDLVHVLWSVSEKSLRLSNVSFVASIAGQLV